MKRAKPNRLKLSHIMHTKISEDTADLLRERAFSIGLDVSAYVRMIVEAHIKKPSSMQILTDVTSPVTKSRRIKTA